MTATPSIDPARFLSEHLERAEPDLLRSMLQTFVQALMGAEADAICGAPYGARTEERVNSRNVARCARLRPYQRCGHLRTPPRPARPIWVRFWAWVPTSRWPPTASARTHSGRSQTSHDDVVLTEGQVPGQGQGQGQGVAVWAHGVLVAVAVEPEPAVPVVGDGTDSQPAVPWAGPTRDEPGEARDLSGVHRRIDSQHRRSRQQIHLGRPRPGQLASAGGRCWGRASRPPARCSRCCPRRRRFV